MNKLKVSMCIFLALVLASLAFMPVFITVADCLNEPPIPEEELLHPEGYTFPLEENEELERGVLLLSFLIFLKIYGIIYL